MADKNSLFLGLSEIEINNFLELSGSFVKEYKAEEYIFIQDELPKYIYIIESGSVVVEKIDINGKRSIVNVFNKKGTVFAEVYIYIQSKGYDYSCYANENSKILCIPKDYLVMDKNSSELKIKIINNMLEILANKCYFLNQKLLMMGSVTLREKLIKFLLTHSEGNEVLLSLNREEMGSYLGVPRPSISRELMNMQRDEIIEVGKNKISFDRKNLENLL